MKPRELYSGAAPAAMAQMGQGLSEAGANIGRITQQGYQNLGQGLASGIQAVGQAYADYKKMGTEIKSTENFYNSLKESKLLPPGLQESIDTTINSEAFKNLGTADKAAYWGNIKSLAGQSIAHNWAMDKVAAEGRFAYDRAKLAADTQLKDPYYRAVAPALVSAGMDTGVSVTPGTPRVRNVSGGVVPRAGGGGGGVDITGGETFTPYDNAEKPRTIFNLNPEKDMSLPADAQAPQVSGGVLAPMQDLGKAIDLNRLTSFEGVDDATQAAISGMGHTSDSWNQLSPDARNSILNSLKKK